MFKTLLLILLLTTGLHHARCQSCFQITESREYEFPGYFESKLGFIPIGMAFSDDSTFFLNTYYSGMYKFRIANNQLLLIDSFVVQEAQDVMRFDSLNSDIFRKRRKTYLYKPYTPNAGIGLGRSFSTSTIFYNGSHLYITLNVNFLEKIEADSGKYLSYDTLEVKSITYIRQPTYLVELDEDLHVSAITFIDNDAFFDEGRSSSLALGIKNFFLSGRSFFSDFSYIDPNSVNTESPALYEWKFHNNVIVPEGFVQNITSSKAALTKIKKMNPQSITLTRAMAKDRDRSYVASIDRLYLQSGANGFELLGQFDLQKTGSLYNMAPYDDMYLILTFKKEPQSENKKERIHPYLFNLERKDILPLIHDSNFRGGLLSRSSNYVFTISFDNGLFKLHRYRITSCTD